MPAHKLSRAALTSLAACSTALMLSACSSPFVTGYMPTGYTYEDDTPITSPKPTQPWFDEAVITDTETLASNTAAWQGAIFELVDKLVPSLPPGQPLALKAEMPVTNQKQAMDHYLRQALLQRGITIAPEQASAAVLTYDAQSLEKKEVYQTASQRLGREAVPEAGSNMAGIYLLRAKLSTSPKSLIADEAVVAVLPGEKVEYMRWPGYSNQPAQGEAAEKPPVYLGRD